MKILFSLILCLSLLSCTDFTTGKRFENDYIVIAGLIYDGETISKENPIVIGRSIPVKGGNLSDFFIADATVFIEDIETNERQDLVFFVDLIESFCGYYDATESFYIKSGKSYKLTAIVDADTIWAVTTVPDSFEILDNEGFSFDENYFPEMRQMDIDEHYPLDIKVSKKEIVVIYKEYFCLENWYEAEIILADILGIGNSYLDSEDDYSNSMDGSPRRNTTYENYLPNDENVFRLRYIQPAFVFYGKHRVSLMSIDDNFYKYLYKSQGYFYGGVTGGIGYFGSASRQTMYTKVTK
ncbi:MAG: DUF4249 domain-containing protein [Candidatus Cloacimonetes bacterium]|nr:DUF4249 domain-containing protein [Candidatus Cloacimonadota bacterium]